jgi:predicted nucleic acid-binding protein
MAPRARPRRCGQSVAASVGCCRSFCVRAEGRQSRTRSRACGGIPLLIFVDTSALYALLDRDDRFHEQAKRTFATLEHEERVTHSYVLVETTAIAHRRLGEIAVRRFIHELVPVLSTVWIDEATHAAGVAALLAALPTHISLVDFVSFEVMREHGISRAFAFGDDFRAAGFGQA